MDSGINWVPVRKKGTGYWSLVLSSCDRNGGSYKGFTKLRRGSPVGAMEVYFFCLYLRRNLEDAIWSCRGYGFGQCFTIRDFTVDL